MKSFLPPKLKAISWQPWIDYFRTNETIIPLLTAADSCQIVLDILDNNKTIYQRGITPSELKQCSPQVLSGNLILVIFKSVMIEKLTVSFRGIKFETLFDLAHIKNYPSSVDYLNYCVNGQKMSHYTKIIDDSLVYDNDLLSPGIYAFPFQFLVDPLLPSSIISSYLNISYKVNVYLSYNTGPSLPSTSMNAQSEVLLIRCLPDSVDLSHDSLIANGNWRNLLIYEFNFPSKFAYQNLPYNFFLNLYPIEDQFQLFEVHSISIQLIQHCQFDKICSNDSLNSLANVSRQKHSEIHKFDLYSKLVNLKDFQQSPAGGFGYSLQFRFPSASDDQDTANKRLVPTIINDKNEGFTTTHNLKVCLEVSQLRTKKSFKCNKFSSNPDPPASIPSYSMYHKCKNEASKYKRMELCFTAPIILLSPQSCHGAMSPPLYSHSNNSIPLKSRRNLNNIVSDKFGSKNKSLVLPPSYTDVCQ